MYDVKTVRQYLKIPTTVQSTSLIKQLTIEGLYEDFLYIRAMKIV